MLLPLFNRTLTNSSSTLAWLVDLGSHWQWLYLIGLLIAGGIATSMQKTWAFMVLVIPLPWIWVASQISPATQKSQLISVASINVHLDNQSPERLIQWIAKAQPDVVVIIEISPMYAEGLKKLDGYPYRHVIPEDSPFGMAMLSRIPMTHVETIRNAESIPRIEAELSWNDRLIAILAYHPMPPISQRYHSFRNTELSEVAHNLVRRNQPAILAGDINATPWSSAFHGLEAVGIRRATGLRPTWPSVGQGWLGIPIDHVLATTHWKVVEQDVGF